MSLMHPAHQPPEDDAPFAHVAATRRWRRRLLVACFLGAVVCGTLGFLEYQCEHGEQVSWRNALYQGVQLFAFHSPHFEDEVPVLLEFGRWLAAATTVLAVYGAARRLFHEELEDWRCGRIKGHLVVCGLGRQGLGAVRAARRQGQEVVVIEREPEPALVAECRQLGSVHVLTGDATRLEALREARVGHAAGIISLLPEDSANCEVAAQVLNLCGAAGVATPSQPLLCRIHLSDPDLRQTLQESLRGGAGAGKVRLEFVDALDELARRLLVEQLPLDHAGVAPDDPREVHLILIGLGRQGRRLAVRAAQLGQFANGRPLHITVIDRKPDANRNALLFHHPGIESVCRWEFHALEVFSPAGRGLLQQLCASRQALTSLVVTFDEEERAFEIAGLLRTLAPDAPLRIALRMRPGTGLDKLITQSATLAPWLGQVVRFGAGHDGSAAAEAAQASREDFARQVHEAYVAQRTDGHAQEHPGQPLPADPTLLPWEALAEDFRESSRQQADHLVFKLRAIGCELAALEDPRPDDAGRLLARIEGLAELEHRRFVAERLVAGWTLAPGPKDPVRRTNPHLVEWSRLPENIKDYDREAIRTIPGRLAGMRLKIVEQKQAEKPAAG